MKKNTVYMFFTLMLLSSIILAVTGCSYISSSSEPSIQEPPVSVAIILGAHANAQSLNLTNPEVVAHISRAAANGGLISVICADGSPQVISAGVYAVSDRYRNANPELLKNDAEKQARAILASLSDVKAETSELDTLEALWQAVRSLAAAPAGSKKIIDIIDTGLSTSGALDFRNNLLSASPETITEFLVSQQAIPDFSGITVNWCQLGAAAPPQPSLSYADIAKLRAIWSMVIQEGGGVVTFSDLPSEKTTHDPDIYPAVSIVNLPPQLTLSIVLEEFDSEDNAVFTETQVQFIGDSDQYVDQDTAETALQPVADYLKSHPGFSVLLVGTTATGEDESFCQQLSQDRANAVKTTLIDMDVPSEQLITKGLGFTDPWHIQDTDSSGQQIEPLAAANRKVMVLRLTESNLAMLSVQP